MGEKLDRIFEYRVLYSKQRELNIPLSPAEKARLERLREQLPERIPTVDDRDPFTLLATPLPVHFVVAGRFGAGTLRNASGAGLAIITVEPPELGQRVIIHIEQALQDIEYTFPCRVVARVLKGAKAMGVAFEGVPSQARKRTRSSGVWPSDSTPTANPLERSERRRTRGA